MSYPELLGQMQLMNKPTNQPSDMIEIIMNQSLDEHPKQLCRVHIMYKASKVKMLNNNVFIQIP
jgi:hypothetical protein